MAMESLIVELLRGKFSREILDTHSLRGDETVVVRRDRLAEILGYLRDQGDLAFEMLVDVTCVDYLGKREPRFEVVYHLLSLRHGRRLRVKVPVGERDPRVPSAAGLYRSADWGEREVAEFFGIVFDGHPNPKKLLLYDGFEGYPLRKDYPKKKRQPLVRYRPDACTDVRGRDCR